MEVTDGKVHQKAAATSQIVSNGGKSDFAYFADILFELQEPMPCRGSI